MSDRIKKLLIILGGVFAVSVLAGMAVFALLGFDAIHQDKESRAFIEEAATAVCSAMNMEALTPLAAPDILKTPRADAERIFKIYAELGKFAGVDQTIGQASQSFSSNDHWRVVTAHYLLRARFEAGPAQIETDLTRVDGEWKIVRFLINSPALAPDAGETAVLGAPALGSGQLVNRFELAREVDGLLKGDEVLLRRNMDKVYALAGLRASEGETSEAMALYGKVLEVNAANIPARMALASLLAGSGKAADAAGQARVVWEMAENAALASEAAKLLASLGQPVPQPERMAAPAGPGRIVLVPMGRVDRRLLESLREKLEERMGMEFPLSTETPPLGKPDRSWTFVFVDDTYRTMRGQMGEGAVEALMNEVGLTQDAMRYHDAKIRFIHAFLERSGPLAHAGATRFDMEAARAEMLTQYDLARLLRQMHDQFPLEPHSPIKGYLAVTDQDLFEADSHFRFGGAVPGYGVISLKRFTAAFNDEEQNRPRLLRRALKQGLSSAGFILDVPRCVNPDCARAYPHSLAELDQKPDTLCALCQERLQACKASFVN